MSAPLFAFVNAKGGSGATTVCAELAKLLRNDQKVVVVDGDLSGKRNLGIVFDALRTLDVSRAGKGIGVAENGNLLLAEIAPTYDTAFTINFNDVEQLAASFAGAGCILADVPIPFAAPVRPFVVRATRFVVVAEPTLLGVASARTMIAELKNFGVPITRIVLLTNHRDNVPGPGRGEIERALETKVIAELPPQSDRNYGKALAAFE